MNIRNLTEAAIIDPKDPVQGLYFGKVDEREGKLAQDEPVVFLKAAGVDVPKNATINVNMQHMPRGAEVSLADLEVECTVTIIVFELGPITIIGIDICLHRYRYLLGKLLALSIRSRSVPRLVNGVSDSSWRKARGFPKGNRGTREFGVRVNPPVA
jgi:hypothetical protein